MKAAPLLLIPALIFSPSLYAQAPPDLQAEPIIEPAAPDTGGGLPDLPPPATDLVDVPASPVADLPAAPVEDLPAADLPAIPPASSSAPVEPTTPADPSVEGSPADVPFGPLEQAKREMEQSEEGYLIKDAGLNDIFQFLAKSAGRQYFHNSKINGPDYRVTGHLNDGNPLMQMEELAFMYGLTLHTKGTTIYALTQSQLSQLPSAEFHYQLKYLRPSDMEQIKEFVKPLLSPGTGIVNFEPKTNTIIVIDSTHRIEQIRTLLHGIDKSKGQIIVETKILRINSTAAERVGVNWASSLGEKGVSLNVARDLSSVFGLPAQSTGVGGTKLVLSPVEAAAVLQAMAEGGIASQVSNPTLITEDNEQATISIIDRIPIITSTTQPGTGGSPSITTEEVRYKIDNADKAITEDPENHREIGISIVVTPTLLPDGTVRMQMRPRSAQITGEVIGQGVDGQPGNSYPRVTESMVESLARVPDGHSLVVGGFYGEIQERDKNKIPLLGDIPVLNFFFKSKESVREQTSLVFIVTPRSYNPESREENRLHGDNLRSRVSLTGDHDWVDEYNPGPAHEPNMARTVRGLRPHQAPYYPTAEEAARQQIQPAPAPNDGTTPSRFSRARKH
jgi:type II secretory pathway component GspD/PulD (secretin)